MVWRRWRRGFGLCSLGMLDAPVGLGFVCAVGCDNGGKKMEGEDENPTMKMRVEFSLL